MQRRKEGTKKRKDRLEGRKGGREEGNKARKARRKHAKK
jgi:hypothetical protein